MAKMHSLIYLEFLLIILLSSKSTANICCTPDQWEAYLYFANGNTVTNEGVTGFFLLNGTVRLSYDYTNQRYYMLINSTDYSPYLPKPVIESGLYIYDYKNGIEYGVSDGTCDKNALITNNMTKQCISDNGEITSRGTIGASNVKTISYDVELTTPRFLKLSVTVMEDSCTPIHITYYTHYSPPVGIGFVYNVDILDFSSGIKDQSIFDVPEPCKHLETKAKEEKSRSTVGTFLRDILLPRVLNR